MKQKTTSFGEASVPTASIQELFEACMAKEEQLLGPGSKNYEKKLLSWLKDLLFGRPVFWPYPIGGFQPFEQAVGKSAAPFYFSVAQTEGDTSSANEWRYSKLLELLRAEKDVEMQWLLLARWLKQEKVCKPEQFLPKSILSSLTKRFSKSQKISATDFSYWAVIKGWKPYFVRLQSDMQKARSERGEPESALREMGYDEAAIKNAITKRTTVSAIMNWIADRKHLELHTLRNAYSRTAGRKRKRPARNTVA
jgi:hypothetical protein